MAEVHFRGIIPILEVIWSRHSQNHDLEVELTMRYFLLAVSGVYCLRGRSYHCAEEALADSSPDAAIRAKHKPHKPSRKGVSSIGPQESRVMLASLWRFPHFFIDSPINQFAVDARNLVKILKNATQMVDEINAGAFTACVNEPSYEDFWRQGLAGSVVTEFVNSHIQTLQEARPENKDDPELLITSWSGMVAAAILYAVYILGTYNAGQSIDRNVHVYLLKTVVCDLKQMGTHLDNENLATKNFWLWKAFVGLISIRRSPCGENDMELQNMVAWLQQRIRARTFVVDGNIPVEEALIDIAWPREFRKSPSIRELCDDIISTVTSK